ncbi:hypothetical protein [Brevibacterium jeotgali]|uniref:Uncharacterized protein n=1 Tax=Brevibacterium jeotgali TaxID=1262550 RepID=A0A2H1L814_9MICO|nr:hypothetical protein [Brevibacterium jeotgali]TWC03357.1 hypothetical protein FB108_2082 [Brevibacterium jeotgali]SMY13019.1 hypothetical protein BJEO58_02627 [Brevibacterium jeotgali]
MGELTEPASGEYRESAKGDGSTLAFPDGAAKRERIAFRLDLVEKNGLLVIGRAAKGAIIGRVVGSVLIGVLGLAVLVLGAESLVGAAGFLLFVVFGIVLPVFSVKRHRQDYSLELTPEAFTVIRRVGRTQETVHRVSWPNVVQVGTVRFGHQPEAPNIPSVVVLGASGIGRRPLVRTLFTREIRGERVTLNQPLAVGRWELVDLLTEAQKRFAPKRQEGPKGAGPAFDWPD